MRNYLDDKPLKLRRERTQTLTSGRPFILAILLCLIAIGLIFFDQQGIISPIRVTIQSAVVPISQRLTGFRHRVDDLETLGQSKADLQATITLLEQEISQLKAEKLRLEQAEVENTFLRQQLAIQDDQPWHLVGAEVTVRPPDAGRRVMLIACGHADGVEVGMAVIGQDPSSPAALVGIVESVSAHTAEVLLITDVSSQVSARVIHAGQASLGLVQGQWQLGSRLNLSHVDRSTQIATGDAVMSAGLTESLNMSLDLAAVPARIPIGTIEQVNTSGQDQTAALRPFVDPDQVRYVWVILNQDD